MTRCEILHPFLFSDDGVTEMQATAGDVCGIPDALVAGLVAEGYVRLAGPVLVAHNLSREAAVGIQTGGGDLSAGRAEPVHLEGDANRNGYLSKAEIMADLDRLGIDYDARSSRDKLDALLRKDKAHREATVNASVEG